MSDPLSEWEIVSAVAQAAAKRITRKVIAHLQSMDETLSGDDSELKTPWDEICVQVQYEASFFWDAYDETVRGILRGYVAELPKHEREAIWLQTAPGTVGFETRNSSAFGTLGACFLCVYFLMVYFPRRCVVFVSFRVSLVEETNPNRVLLRLLPPRPPFLAQAVCGCGDSIRRGRRGL
jgi:hypothetical protein